MQKIILIIFLSLICFDVYADSLLSRVETFYTYLLDGKELHTRDWMYADEETLRYLETFGGLASAAKSLNEQAQKKDGVKNIEVDLKKCRNNLATVIVTVTFNDGDIKMIEESWIYVMDTWKKSGKEKSVDTK